MLTESDALLTLLNIIFINYDKLFHNFEAIIMQINKIQKTKQLHRITNYRMLALMSEVTDKMWQMSIFIRQKQKLIQ